MKRNLTIISMALVLLTVLFSACAAHSKPAATSSAPSASTQASAAAQGKVFTVAELAKYNGKDGMPAYVAVDGVVYDVSNFPLWQGGTHQGLHQAGMDLTEEIKQSPHGASKIKDLPVVGTLAK
jgi:predicted heme/steroid binding protein